MENNDKNNLSSSVTVNTATEPTTPIQNHTANLDRKRDELMSSNKINDEVSSYLNELGEKDNQSPVGSLTRPPEEKKNLKQSIVRTFKSDAEEAIKMEKMSAVSIALAEEKRKQKYQPIEPSSDSPKSKKILIFIISLLFVFGGIGAFNFNYIKEKISADQTQKQTAKIESLINVDLNIEINLSEIDKDKKDVGKFLSEIINTTTLSQNSILNIYFTKNSVKDGKEIKMLATPKEFFPVLSSKIPDILLRSLSSKYMIGAYSQNGNHPFLILKTNSYESGFAGMLSWEKNIAEDLKMLFPKSASSSTQEGTTTINITSYKKDFEDILVKNKDIRALRDDYENIFLVYSMPDKETIIITSDINTITELFDRILRSRMVR